MERNDAELIYEILQGDSDAFSPLVKKYQKGVHALAWRKIGDFHVAQEITQDAFLKAYQKLGTLKNHNAFAGWLYVIVAHLCLDWFRENRLPIESLDIADANEVDQVSYSRYLAEKQATDANETRRDIVKELLQKLPESERTVMTLHYLGEMTIKAISEFLGISPNTVKSRLSRARIRLKKEETMIRQNLASFQLPTNITENIMQEVSRITPTVPAGNKPVVPWVVSAASAILVFLLMGAGTQYLTRFQKPYNLNATSEATVDVIEALFVLDSPAKPAVRNQAGGSTVPGKTRGAGQKPEDLLFAAVPVDETEVASPEPQWLQTKGPEGGNVSTLFVASNEDLYAGSGTNLYKLKNDGQAWSLINFNTPFKGSWQITERGDTLYVISDTEVFTSTDKGETWNSLGPRPEGHLIGSEITDEAFYLGLVDDVFRSTDIGKSWTRINDDLGDRKIRAIAAVENTLFVGTDSGLYRHNSQGWNELSIGKAENIRALASAEHQLYAVVGDEVTNQFVSQMMSAMTARKATLALYRSTDYGDSWQSINPDKILPVQTSGVTTIGVQDTKPKPTSKIMAAGDSIMLLDSGRTYYSSDVGETWSILHSSHSDMDKPPIAVMLNENTFYRGGGDGVHRSTDAGKTWQQFNTGLVNTSIANLVVVQDTLYANIGHLVLTSSDGGESWLPIPGNPGNLMRMVEFKDVLYARGAKGMNPRLFRLSAEDNILTPVPGMPAVPEMPAFGGSGFDERLTEELNLALLGTISDEDMKSLEAGQHLSPENFDADKLNEAYSKVIEETMLGTAQSLLGSFAVSDETYYMESSQTLFRWRPGTTEWHNTGLVDEAGAIIVAFTDIRDIRDITSAGFGMAVSGRTVYVGKRNGHLFQSFDEGDTWKDVTADLPFSFASYNVISFAGSTVYIATDKGVAYSDDDTHWHTAVDGTGTPLVMVKLAIDGTTVYGATEQQVYLLKEGANTWQEVTPEVPGTVASLAINENILYVGTLGRGVLRFTLDK